LAGAWAFVTLCASEPNEQCRQLWRNPALNSE
jgi:hypothetical protein